MSLVVKWLLQNWKTVLIGGTALLIVGYLWWLRSEVADLENANAQLRADKAAALVAEASAKQALDLANEDHARALWVVGRERDNAISRVRRKADRQKEIDDVAREHDRPVGPVLEQYYDRLRSAD